MGFPTALRGALGEKTVVSIPGRDLWVFRPLRKIPSPFPIRIVSIPGRDLWVFRLPTSPLTVCSVWIEVSIPGRDLWVFRRDVRFPKAERPRFQSLVGIYGFSDLKT